MTAAQGTWYLHALKAAGIRATPATVLNLLKGLDVHHTVSQDLGVSLPVRCQEIIIPSMSHFEVVTSQIASMRPPPLQHMHTDCL